MKDGFVKVAAAAIEIVVADVKTNTAKIKEKIKRADEEKVNLLVLPELCITGCSCEDLFFSSKLLNSAYNSLFELRDFTAGKYPIIIVSLPIMHSGAIYNCAAVLYDGNILGIVPKSHLQGSANKNDSRYFASGANLKSTHLGGTDIPFGKMLFRSRENQNFCFGIEIGEDLCSATKSSHSLCLKGATIIANPCASYETVCKADHRRRLIESATEKLICGYILSNADMSESTTNVVFSRHNIICENGKILAENAPFGQNDFLLSEIDVNALSILRARTSSDYTNSNIDEITFSQKLTDIKITRKIEKTPFVPEDDAELSKRIETILNIQCFGLKKRLEHTNAKSLVIGVSGGLDSTLALLAAAKAMALSNRSLNDIIAVTMPCFGTSERTKKNAQALCEILGVTLKEINIKNSVLSHFNDIGQDADDLNTTFENAQARERTQVLMDLANKTDGLVLGTGDLSELALGWATYNGDHMSMYGINADIPKTLIKRIVTKIALSEGGRLSEILLDIVNTPVSPELLPADSEDKIVQKTEDLVGPYELHDFFLYRALHFGDSPAKIFRLAKLAFDGEYSDATILHWLKTFFRRFFSQQFKRSCLPDGAKVGSVSLSPRGDLKMPSDASAKIWLDEIESIRI